MKLTGLGLAIPEKSSVENAANKVTEQPTTTTQMPKLKIARFEELPSGNEAIGLLWCSSNSQRARSLQRRSKEVVLKIALGRLIGTGSLREIFFVCSHRFSLR
jgi:hypothetical protein